MVDLKADMNESTRSRKNLDRPAPAKIPSNAFAQRPARAHRRAVKGTSKPISYSSNGNWPARKGALHLSLLSDLQHSCLSAFGWEDLRPSETTCAALSERAGSRTSSVPTWKIMRDIMAGRSRIIVKTKKPRGKSIVEGGPGTATVRYSHPDVGPHRRNPDLRNQPWSDRSQSGARHQEAEVQRFENVG